MTGQGEKSLCPFKMGTGGLSLCPIKGGIMASRMTLEEIKELMEKAEAEDGRIIRVTFLPEDPETTEEEEETGGNTDDPF